MFGIPSDAPNKTYRYATRIPISIQTANGKNFLINLAANIIATIRIIEPMIPPLKKTFDKSIGI